MITIAERNEISQSAFFKRVKNGMNSFETAKKGKGYAVHLELAERTGLRTLLFTQGLKEA
ncbi:hypothetical protein P4J12_33995 [Bacillus cereus]|nr:hypothetical protein [Bacillus cereus]